jgi:stage II sporulation protein R
MKNQLSYTLPVPKEKIEYLKTNIISVCLLLIISFLSFMQFLHTSEFKNLQEDISHEILRFHVVANSDSKQDQEIKLVIKDELTTALKPSLEHAKNIDEARVIIQENLSNLEQIANQTLMKNGYEYTASASLEKGYFPLKVYGDLSLPPGEYEAIRIELGTAKGQNWWCIMFPPLCFVDSTYSVVPDSSKDQLKNVLTEEEYDMVFKKKDVKVKVKLKIVDWFLGKQN